MKFGEAIVKYIEINDEDRELLKGYPEDVKFVYRYISSPICGFNAAYVYFDTQHNMQIKEFGFQNEVQEKDMAAAKARSENVRTAVGKWLGIDSFDTKNDVSTFEDNGLRVTIRNFVMENKSAKQAGWSSNVHVDIEYITKTEAE